MRRLAMSPNTFPGRVLLREFEGGAVYTAEHADKFYVIQDEGTMADLQSDEDRNDLAGDLVKILEFDAPAERAAYIHERGWDVPNRTRS
jgi:hypothetical protein